MNNQKVLRTASAAKECKLIQVKIPKIVNQASKDYLGTGFIGFDKDGCAVRLVNLGSIDLKGLVHAVSTIDTLKLFVWYLEQDERIIREENRRTGKNAYQSVIIFNVENLAASQALYKPVIDNSLTGLKLLQEFYHDFLKCVFVINAPTIFSTMYKMLKPAIGEDLQKRIKIYGYDDWKEPLLQMVGADVLPKQLGGNRVDANNDPRCSALVGQGGIIPTDLYSKQECFLDSEMPGVETIQVPAGSFLNIPVIVKEANSMVKWHIQAKDNDIGIALYYDPESAAKASKDQASEEVQNDENDELVAQKKADQKAVLDKLEPLTCMIRSQCQVTPEIGHTLAWRAGKYFVHLDNSYSWMSPKTVMYKFEVIPPSEQYESNEDKLIESIQNL